jgi:hypothetical protein
MKNVSVKLMGAAAVIGVSAMVYSFTSDNEPDGPEFKKYEVIRMVDGELTTHDTIIAATSAYTAENYLNDLGYESDENVNIINLLEMNLPSIALHGDHSEMKHDENIIFIEMDEEGVVKEEIKGDGVQEIRIEKKVIKNGENGEELDIEVDVEALLSSINIDSIIASAIEMHGEGDSNQIVMHKMIVMDEEFEGNHPDMKMEFQHLNTEDADFHKEMGDEHHKMEVAVWGDDEDFTMVIISDPSMEGAHKTATIDEGKALPVVKVFPNPTSSSAQLQLNFEDKASTAIMISDSQGRVVMKLELGNFEGQFNHEIDVDSWSKGVYLIQVDHGNEKIIEKLVVE